MRELVEALETASIPGGFTCLHFALPYLMEINNELENGTFVYDVNQTVAPRS